jgi:hypothetical protein
MAGDVPKARKVYEDFFIYWKDADPNIPVLIQARNEYAALNYKMAQGSGHRTQGKS